MCSDGGGGGGVAFARVTAGLHVSGAFVILYLEFNFNFQEDGLRRWSY